MLLLFLHYIALLQCLSGAPGVRPRDFVCSDNSDITIRLDEHSKQIDPDNKYNKIHFTSLIVDNIENGATACFELTTPDNDMVEYALTLHDASGSVGIEDQYEFGIPNITAKCTCSCSDKSGILNECDAEKNGFCDSYSSLDRCVTIKESTDNNKGCVSLAGDADYCCAIGMKQSDILERFKAFKLGNKVQNNVKVTIYPRYTDTSVYHELELNLPETEQIPEDKGLVFHDVSGTVEGDTGNIVNDVDWYIGKSSPYSRNVYETTEEIDSKHSYDLSKVGWAKYTPDVMSYQLQDGPSDEDIRNAFTATVNDCGKSDITSTFKSPKLADFHDSLVTLKSKHATVVDKVEWEATGIENHGRVEWTYKRSVFVADLKFKMQGHKDEFSVSRLTAPSTLGEATAQVVVTEHGIRYIQINMTGTLGNIFATYTVTTNGEERELSFSFEVTDRTFYTKYYTDTDLKCVLNSVGKLCLNVAREKPTCFHNVKCTETRIKDPEHHDDDIETDTVVSNDPLNWRTWAKFANPLEWFNGIDSYQEAIMLVVELVGSLGIVFLVLKILRIFGVLGKCCRFMWCCCLCPKTEKKIKKRADSFNGSMRRRFTHGYEYTKRRLTQVSIRTNRVNGDQGEKGDVGEDVEEKTAPRSRLNTEAAWKYIRSKFGSRRGDDRAALVEHANTYELTEPIKPRPSDDDRSAMVEHANTYGSTESKPRPSDDDRSTLVEHANTLYESTESKPRPSDDDRSTLVELANKNESTEPKPCPLGNETKNGDQGEKGDIGEDVEEKTKFNTSTRSRLNTEAVMKFIRSKFGSRRGDDRSAMVEFANGHEITEPKPRPSGNETKNHKQATKQVSFQQVSFQEDA